MAALIKKDLFAVRTYVTKQYGIMILLFIFLSIFMGSSAYLAGILGLIGFSLTISCFSFDEANGFQRYALTLPVSKKQIIGAKYLLTIISLSFALFINLTIGSVLAKYLQTPFIEHLTSSLVLFLMFLFTSSIGMPLLIKLGVEKSRVPMMLTYMVPFFLGVFGISILNQLNVRLPSPNELVPLIIAVPIIIVLLFIGSFFVSVKIFEYKEI